MKGNSNIAYHLSETEADTKEKNLSTFSTMNINIISECLLSHVPLFLSPRQINTILSHSLLFSRINSYASFFSHVNRSITFLIFLLFSSFLCSTLVYSALLFPTFLNFFFSSLPFSSPLFSSLLFSLNKRFTFFFPLRLLFQRRVVVQLDDSEWSVAFSLDSVGVNQVRPLCCKYPLSEQSFFLSRFLLC